MIIAQLIGPPRPFAGTNRVDEHRRARSIGETDVASDIQQTPRLFALGFDIVPIAVDPDERGEPIVRPGGLHAGPPPAKRRGQPNRRNGMT